MTKMEARVDEIEKDLEFVKRRLDGLHMELENMNSRMDNVEGSVKMVKDCLMELTKRMMNRVT